MNASSRLGTRPLAAALARGAAAARARTAQGHDARHPNGAAPQATPGPAQQRGMPVRAVPSDRRQRTADALVAGHRRGMGGGMAMRGCL